ncbi:hypothetical protein BGZ80_003483 [Entomortierella chlamydospora]|uniref:Uncharacterized protein n=1 Tax=Entomortierella chlamydospora TaxID=101097 RepID=A0A9P6SWL6_9FUNG|nr:hypothetical protein BGZ80_003483 [Entomortierella chlamydospora]
MAMEDAGDQQTQAFRASLSKEILEIPTRLDKTGQRIVLWKDIQLGFENVRCIKKGGALVLFLTDENFEYLNPLRIGYYPGIMLDVIQGSSGNHEIVTLGSSSSSLAPESESGMLNDTPASSELGASNASVTGDGSVKEESTPFEDVAGTNDLSQTIADLSITSVDGDADNLLTQIQVHSQAILSQEYELHERTSPRLFVVLPKTTRLRDGMNKPLFNQFRLFFLCECGAHTLSKGTKLKHEIHFTNHEGYALNRPNEFFNKYGSYVLAMMLAVKHGVTAPGHVITPLACLNLAEKFCSTRENMALAKDKVNSLVNAMVTFLQEKDTSHPHSEASSDIGSARMNDTNVLEVENLQELRSYLKVGDQDSGFGGLYRFITPEGHVKWVCQDHYREIHQGKAIQQLKNVVKVNHGAFIEEEGRIVIILGSIPLAKQFYGAIVKTSSVQDLDITLKWDATLDDIRTFATAVTNAKIARLSLNGFSFKGPAHDYVNDCHRYDPIMQLMSNNQLQCLRLKDFDSFYSHINFSAITMAPRLRTLSFASDIDLKTTAAQSSLSHILENSPSLVELSLETEEIRILFDIIAEKVRLLPNLSTMRVYYRRDDEPTLTVDYSQMKIVAATMTKYRMENISATDREVFETGQLTRVNWKGTPQQEDEVKLLDILCRNPKLSELLMECDPSRVPAITNLVMATRKSILSQGKFSALCKVEFIQDPATPEAKDFVTSTIEFSDSPLGATIQVSTDISMQTISPRSSTDSLYVIFHQQGWSIKTLETNATFNDDLAQLLDNSSQFKGSKITRLALDTSSLTPAGLDRIDRVINLSHSLERLSLRLDGLDEGSRLEKSAWLLGRHSKLLNTLILHSKLPDLWMPQFAETLPTRDDLPLLEGFHLLCYDNSSLDAMAILSDKTITTKSSVEWIAAMVSSQPHVLWSSTRPSTPDVFSTHQSLVAAVEAPQVWTSLRSISLKGIHLQPEDWLTVIEAIDFSALESLSLVGSNFDLEQLEILVDCILADNESQVPLNSLQLNYTNLVDYMDDEAPWELLAELEEKAPLLVIQGLERPG